MNEIEKFASEVCENRARVLETKKIEKAKESLVEEYVRYIVDIFNISNNSEESTVLIWKIKLFKDYNIKIDEIKLAFYIEEDDWHGYFIEQFECHKDWGHNSELIQKISRMIIPKGLYNYIIDYFKTRLSKQFETIHEEEGLFGEEGTVIKIKVPIKAKSE